MTLPSHEDLKRVSKGFDPDPARSHSLRSEAYTEKAWSDFESEAIFKRSWQWVCHGEKLREPGAYCTTVIAGQPICVIRDMQGALRGEGRTRRIMCPYHAWTYDLTGQLRGAPSTNHIKDFDIGEICLDRVQVEEFCGFVFVNLDPDAAPLAEASGDLAKEITHWAPDIERLTFAHRLTYDIKSNWKNVVDNFLECYHCPVAHKDFCTLVDMNTYRVTTHGIYSSHMAEAGKTANKAYSVDEATVKDHAVWWLWPNTCIMRYPGRGNMIILHVIPVGPDRTLETSDFFLESPEPTGCMSSVSRARVRHRAPSTSSCDSQAER